MPETTTARDLAIWNGVVDDDLHGLTPESIAKVETFALALGDMTDEQLYDECRRRIYDAALMQRFRFPVPDHALCTLCFNESQRRDPDTGAEHRGASIYARAHKDLMRDHGYARPPAPAQEVLTMATFDFELDLRDRLFTGILLTLYEARHELTASTIATRADHLGTVTGRALQVLHAEGVVTPGTATAAGTERWMLTDWGRDWARIAAEREARLATKARRRPYHYGDARGDGRPPEEHWCEWCAGYYGVPHEISDNRAIAVHVPGGLCRHARSSHGCACIDCATLHNDRTILTHRPKKESR